VKTAFVSMFLIYQFFSTEISSQQFQFLKAQNTSVIVPFEFYNNFILINIRLNGLPLRFILDTGAEHTFLFQQEIADLLGLEQGRKVQLMGADLSREFFARVTPNTSIMLEDQCHINTPILVLEEDFLEMENAVGLPISGILGSGVLKNFIVKIDYSKAEITLYHPEFFRKPNSFSHIPIEIEKSKPFIQCNIITSGAKLIPVRLLLDTGASLSTLVYATPKNGINIPDTVITGTLGIGLGGNLRGYIGKLQRFDLGPFTFEDIMANYQKVELSDSILMTYGKDGIIGNAILSKFTLILDYGNSQLHIKPNRQFKKKIQYDKSGLMLITTGKELKTIMVMNIINGSPAHDAGIQPGNIVTHINGISTRFIGFNRVFKKLSSKAGRKIKMKLKNNKGEIYKTEFILRDLL
jgi:hypothetical protein